jgi:Cu+-exporting ATPase
MELQVEGMTCVNCASSVQRYLERKGLDEVVVDFASGEVRFISGKEKLEIEEIKKGIEKLGFTVVEEGKKGPWLTMERKVALSAVLTAPLLLGHLFMVAGIHLPFLENAWTQFALALPVYIIGFIHFGKSAWSSVKSGVPNMDVLIFLGSTAAFLYSLVGLYLQEPNYIFFETSATIITLVLIGNLMEHRAVKQTTSSIEELTRLQPQKARKVMPSGTVVQIDYKEVVKGDELQVNHGDKVPADGIILSGEALFDESVITGESLPVDKKEGDRVIGGALVQEGNFRMNVTASGTEATLGQMIELVKSAQRDKPKIQRLADKISAIFVPVVVGIALLTFLISWFFVGIPFSNALMNSVAVLVISCPCALGLATPTAVTVGVGRLARNGILIKGGTTIERFARIRNYVFDKTGTLTTGSFKLKSINYFQEEPGKIDQYILKLEQHSSHPIAHSLVEAFRERVNGNGNGLSKVRELKGLGMEAVDEQNKAIRLTSSRGAASVTTEKGHDLYLTRGKELLATLDLEDDIREDAREMVDFLKREGHNPVLLSGDKENKTRTVAGSLGISEYFSEQRPEEKLERIAALSSKAPTAMVGDGINDAPALARADLGISISGGTQAAIQSAQVILLNGKLSQLPKAISISKHTLLTIRQNLFWAFAYNVVAIPIAAAGYLNPMWAALFMAFSDVIVIGNSLRLKRKKI